MSNKSIPTLYQLQSLMANAIMRPLDKDNMQAIWIDGSSTSDYASEFIKPNKKLTSFERLEIYNQQYWYRTLESLQDDFAGVNALLGHKRFEVLTTAYLTRYPSRSYTLNHLGQYLANFIQEEPQLTAPDTEAVYDTACVEYAEVKAFEAQAKEPLHLESLKTVSPAQLVLQIQPSVNLLELDYAVDDFLLQLNKGHSQSIESNAVANRTVRFVKAIRPKKRHTYLVVHRLDNAIYYKRLDKDQYLLLNSIKAGKTLMEACTELLEAKTKVKDQEKLALKVNKSFTTWMELGWFSQ